MSHKINRLCCALKSDRWGIWWTQNRMSISMSAIDVMVYLLRLFQGPVYQKHFVWFQSSSLNSVHFPLEAFYFLLPLPFASNVSRTSRKTWNFSQKTQAASLLAFSRHLVPSWPGNHATCTLSLHYSSAGEYTLNLCAKCHTCALRKYSIWLRNRVAQESSN